MYKTFNYIINSIIPLIPKSFIKIFANRYIAGVKNHQALNVVESINKLNLCATLDILGEHTLNNEEAINITKEYIQLYTQIYKNNLDCNISIKPTHIGSDIDYELFIQNMNLILNKAKSYNNFLRLDMENHKLTDLTLKTYNNYINKNLGIVLQAYLYRTKNDILSLKEGSNIRLCKGIYNESAKIAIKDAQKINENYLELLKIAFKRNIYTGIATHDEDLINKSCKIINELNVSKDKFEFQVLYGVPMKNKINELLDKKYKVRVYIPYGKDWYKYSIRRIKENPNISKYIIKNFFKKNIYT